MKIDVSGTLDSIKEGTQVAANVAHEKTSEFHEKYVSKVLPDCGKYGEAATFVAEMAPGVSEYNAIKDGDWTGFAIAAGIDVAAFAIGTVTFGAGYGAVKGGTSVAKAGVKVAAKEVAEAGAKKAVKEVAEAGAEKAVKEIAEAGAEKIVKEVAEASAEKAVKEIAEAGAEKAVKEVAEAGAEKAVKEVTEAGVEKATKEIVENGAEKVAKEITETGAEKITKEVAETGAEKITKETTEAGAEKFAKETAEAGVEKITKETTENADGIVKRYLECKNKGLEGTKHPITGVEFVRKTVDDGMGELVEGVFPKFDSLADVKLPPELYKESNFKQFKEANRQLLDKIVTDSGMRNKFSPDQIKQVIDGITTGRAPDGFIWHHNEETGVLQLVDEFIHSNTGHTAGRAIWGGGY